MRHTKKYENLFYFRNTDKEIEKLKNEIRERNDLINMLQSQNDDLREEKLMFTAANGYSKKSVEGDLVLL